MLQISERLLSPVASARPPRPPRTRAAKTRPAAAPEPRRRRPIGRRGWAFLAAMFAAAALWASLIAIVTLVAHHHPAG